MRAALVLGGVAAATAALGVVGARRAAAGVRRNPSPVPYDVLRLEPKGDETFVVRPDGTRLRVLTAGEGPTVVLAHGVAVTVIEWNQVWQPLLDAGFRVVAFDQRGHGGSTIGADGVDSLVMAEDYLAVLEHVGGGEALLVGHSMGGFLALRAVLDVPGVAERLRGLALVSTFAGNVAEKAPQTRLQIPLITSGVLQRMLASPTVATLFGASVCGDAPSPAAIDVFVETFLAQDLIALAPIFRAFSDEDRGDRLAEVGVPTVVVCGRADRTTPPHLSERLAAGIPGARTVWVDGVGHMLNWEAPGAIVDAVSSLAARPV